MITDFSLAESEVATSYGDIVSVYEKSKSLRKFGNRDDIGTSFATVWSSPDANETYLATNGITSLSSSSAADTGTITIEGHTVDGSGNFTFVVQSVPLTGQTVVTLATPVARVSRMFNNGNVVFVGEIYAHEGGATTAGVPDVSSTVHCVIPAGFDQSFKAATTISNRDYFFITGIYGAIFKKTTAVVDFHLDVRLKGGVFRTQYEWSVASTGTSDANHIFSIPLIVPKNSDVRVQAVASTTAVEASGGFAGVFASVR